MRGRSTPTIAVTSLTKKHPCWKYRAAIQARAGLSINWKRLPKLVELKVIFRFKHVGRVRKGDNPRLWKGTRPDLDNCLKAVKDALTDSGVVWKDDSCVVRTVMEKYYAAPGEEPGTLIVIEEIDTDLYRRQPVRGKDRWQGPLSEYLENLKNKSKST